MEPTIIASPATPIGDTITMSNLGRLYSSCYVSYEFSLTNRFRKEDLVLPLAGTILTEGSENGVYWGKASTSTQDGIISVGSATGDFERVSLGGIVDELRCTPAAIGVASFWRAIVQRA